MPDTDTTVAILLAAGASTRMGDTDKLWASLAGRPLVAHGLRMLAALPDIDLVVVAAPAARHATLHDLARGLPCTVRCVEGGPRRRDSVAAALASAPDAAWYLVHDAARPLATAALAARVLAAAREHGAAIPAVPVIDTIKRIDAAGRVVDTLDRAALRAAQTPQAFAGDLLRRAHAQHLELDATDDAALVAALGAPVATVPGAPENLKVTYPADLAIAAALLDHGADRT
jgi:2-C-methyl-D-erythritol 4-phosphate cytidylyltransferase